MDFPELLAALRKGWWLPLVGLVAGGSAALALSLVQTPTYTSETQFFVSTADSASTADIFQGGQAAQQRVASYAQLITDSDLTQDVIERLDLDMTPRQLADELSATPVTDTVLLDVAVTDPSPERAQAIATAVGAEFTDLVSLLESPTGGGASPVKVTVTQQPTLPDEPSSPATLRNTAIGLFAGLVLGSAAAVARVRLDRSVRDADDAAALIDAPVVGVIVRDQQLKQSSVIDDTSNTGAKEGFRQLRTNLQFLDIDHPPRSIVVSSAVPSEGKTTLTVNLGLALAEAGCKVSIIDADLRRPRVTRYLGMVGGAGLTNILAGSADLEDVVQPFGDGTLSVIGAGPAAPNPAQILASNRMRHLIEQLRDLSDYVLIDAPPLLPVADASGLAVLADGVLLSVHYGKTLREELRQAAATLGQVRARTLGLVFNLVPPRESIGRAYGYQYTDAYALRRSAKHKRSKGAL